MRYLWESHKEKSYLEELDVHGIIIFKLSDRQHRLLWTGLIWFRLGTGRVLL
jgi:hypothetical protein